MKEDKRKRKEKVNPKDLKCGQQEYVFSPLSYWIPYLPGGLEIAKLCIIRLTYLKYALMELVKQLCAISLISINIGVSGAGSLQLSSQVFSRCLITREPRTQPDAVSFALCLKTSLYFSLVKQGKEATWLI